MTWLSIMRILRKEYFLTEVDMVIFTGLSGDFNPLHTDEEFAKTTIFGRVIAQGALTFAIMTGLWDMLRIIRVTVIAFYGVDKLRFAKPVYLGDTLRVKITAIEKRKERWED